jgi:hypothetical protein
MILFSSISFARASISASNFDRCSLYCRIIFIYIPRLRLLHDSKILSVNVSSLALIISLEEGNSERVKSDPPNINL